MSPDAEALIYTCTVCDEQAEAAMTAACNWCNSRYHLNQRSDVEARDCGLVWVDEQYLALQFACNTCLAAADGVPQPAARQPARSTAQRATDARPRRYKRRT